MRNFRDLEIWKSGILLVKKVYLLVNTFPSAEKYGLSSQMSRSAISIPSNIAEGCSRESQKDFSRFLQIALGSSFELETQLLISLEVGFISQSKYSEIIESLNQLQKSINSLKKYAEKQTLNR
ncbi:four helix bundle protein [Croceitalea sp. MTPC5]|uniref:four helix bundle protein n=1 Tax=Croceitalea sp. MTPC5 TaxID=3056565 RepID=UPI002B38ED89|nr:four helix bundle protein [Croceitalea sp. MTPC5]